MKGGACRSGKGLKSQKSGGKGKVLGQGSSGKERPRKKTDTPGDRSGLEFEWLSQGLREGRCRKRVFEGGRGGGSTDSLGLTAFRTNKLSGLMSVKTSGGQRGLNTLDERVGGGESQWEEKKKKKDLDMKKEKGKKKQGEQTKTRSRMREERSSGSGNGEILRNGGRILQSWSNGGFCATRLEKGDAVATKGKLESVESRTNSRRSPKPHPNYEKKDEDIFLINFLSSYRFETKGRGCAGWGGVAGDWKQREKK